MTHRRGGEGQDLRRAGGPSCNRFAECLQEPNTYVMRPRALMPKLNEHFEGVEIRPATGKASSDTLDAVVKLFIVFDPKRRNGSR